MAKKKEPDKLAQDAAAALAAGMSYGKWKAMQGNPVVIKKQEIVPDGWLICKHCGEPFKPKTKRKQFYCGAWCQSTASRERNEEKLKEYRKAYDKKRWAERKGEQHGQGENVRYE